MHHAVYTLCLLSGSVSDRIDLRTHILYLKKLIPCILHIAGRVEAANKHDCKRHQLRMDTYG